MSDFPDGKTPELVRMGARLRSRNTVADRRRPGGCSSSAQIERPQELVELRALQSVAAEKRVELRLLTEALCGQEAGVDRLRRWLGRQEPERKLSPP